MSDPNNNRTFTRELLPAFTLEYKYFDKLRHAIDVAIYAQVEKLRYASLPLNDVQMHDFCSKMNISKEDLHNTYELLIELGLLKDGK